MSLLNRIKKGWNVFVNEDKPQKPKEPTFGYGSFGSLRPDRIRVRPVNSKSIMTSIVNRIGVDFSGVEIRHIRLDEDGRYIENMNSSLNECLLVEPNLDQSPTEFRRDLAMTVIEEGVAAIVPVDTDIDPDDSTAFKIESMRIGTITQWYPNRVRVKLYREDNGRFEEVTVPKHLVAIVENPFYTIMNEPNSTLQRLARKMALMDVVDEQIGSGKLDLIVQLPYVVKGSSKREQAERRRSELEEQLRNSNYGVAYTDGTERVIQLNRPMENNLVKNVESLTKLLYDQLGITEEILNGTADEQTMLNYQNRIVKPLIIATIESMRRKFLSKTARTQGQSINHFQDPFALTTASNLAELGDKFTRNAILSSNEVRQIIGFKPVTDDPDADKLMNHNMPQPKEGEAEESYDDESESEDYNSETEEDSTDSENAIDTSEVDAMVEEFIQSMQDKIAELEKALGVIDDDS